MEKFHQFWTKHKKVLLIAHFQRLQAHYGYFSNAHSYVHSTSKVVGFSFKHYQSFLGSLYFSAKRGRHPMQIPFLQIQCLPAACLLSACCCLHTSLLACLFWQAGLATRLNRKNKCKMPWTESTTTRVQFEKKKTGPPAQLCYICPNLP